MSNRDLSNKPYQCRSSDYWGDDTLWELIVISRDIDFVIVIFEKVRTRTVFEITFIRLETQVI